jgi:hypothetical protein
LAFHSGCEADHSPPSCAEVKEWVELCLHSPNAPSWRGARLGGAQCCQGGDESLAAIFVFSSSSTTVYKFSFVISSSFCSLVASLT